MEHAKSGPRRQGGVQDLYGLDAAVPVGSTESARGRDNTDPAQRALARANPQSPEPVKRIQQRLTVVHARKAPQVAAEGQVVVQFPSGVRRRKYGAFIGFFICVIVPIILASIYYGYFASRQYVAEFRFTVRDVSPTSVSSAASGLMGLLGATSGSAGNDNYLVIDYLTSRQAVDELQERLNIIKHYSQPGIDWWSRFNDAQPREKFVDYWQKMVTARFDLITGIATAQVRAFSPQDALLIANTMVKLSEQLVNGIETRSQNDAVKFARDEVDKAQERLKAARVQLTEYRNKFGIIDPTTSVAASNSALVQSQRSNLAVLETQLTSLLSQNLAPSAPAIMTLKSQIASTREQLSRTEGDVAQGRNGSALSKIVGEYEQLSLEVQFAQTMVTSTMAALENARANAAAQHLYITPYVRPSLPESSTYPNRPLAILTVAALAFAFWVTMLLLVRSIRERFG